MLSVALAAVSFGFALGREAKNPAAGEHESLEDGGVYVVKTKTYKRHGSLSIEEKPFQLERSKETVEYTVDGEGRITGVSQSIKSDDESKSFLLELTGNRYSVTDLKTGGKSLGARVTDKTCGLTEPLGDPNGETGSPTTLSEYHRNVDCASNNTSKLALSRVYESNNPVSRSMLNVNRP